jgi:hypothetical protein
LPEHLAHEDAFTLIALFRRRASVGLFDAIAHTGVTGTRGLRTRKGDGTVLGETLYLLEVWKYVEPAKMWPWSKPREDVWKATPRLRKLYDSEIYTLATNLAREINAGKREIRQ